VDAINHRRKAISLGQFADEKGEKVSRPLLAIRTHFTSSRFRILYSCNYVDRGKIFRKLFKIAFKLNR